MEHKEMAQVGEGGGGAGGGGGVAETGQEKEHRARVCKPRVRGRETGLVGTLFGGQRGA